MSKSQENVADICLILEGTYPYVSGGVSTWVHQILEMYPEWKFALFYLGAQKDPSNKPKYSLPSNVVGLTEVYLFDDDPSDHRKGNLSHARWAKFFENIRRMGVRVPRGDAVDVELFQQAFDTISQETSVGFDSFWRHHETWDILREVYERYAADDSFLDFFWTLRFLLQPIWRLSRAMSNVPRARLYHTACTGYAGLTAAIAASHYKRPLVLTEHGIYLRERIADISRSKWIPDQHYKHPGLSDPLGTLRRLWIGFFDVAARMCYHKSDTIVSLFEKNAQAQVRFGANDERIRIIPNGIETEQFTPLASAREERKKRQPSSKVVGFLGRVVTIKDIKTLLRAARKVISALPDARFLVAGPTEEEPDYYRECLDLRQQLHLQREVEFVGSQNRMDFLPKLDLMILTSISEGLPFVVLESLAAGVPVVSTDVGACSEIILGSSMEQPPLGAAGCIAPVGNTEELAQAVIQVLTDTTLLAKMSDAGRARVTRNYHSKSIRLAYSRLYSELLAKTAAT
ncbi:MAG: GT4 family glycosyltransferase PelF [Verrucomicrobiaceae bacterium]|nr:GT4 family glycosyltransferase PelF [Verrucomicrobiaceae bacterium]